MNLTEAIELKERFIKEINPLDKDIFIGPVPMDISGMVNACKLEYTVSSQVKSNTAVKQYAINHPEVINYMVYVVDKGGSSLERNINFGLFLSGYISENNIDFII